MQKSMSLKYAPSVSERRGLLYYTIISAGILEMCSGSEAGLYVRLIGCVHHSTLGLRVIKKKKKDRRGV